MRPIQQIKIGIFTAGNRLRKMTRLWRVLGCALVLSASPAIAELRLCKIFSDGMVLQRDKPVKVWGWCTAGDTVTVTFAEQTKTAVADDTGRWDVALEPMAASAVNRAMTITTAQGGESKTIENILVGEVWISSGQSNMDWSILSCEANAQRLAASDSLPNLRVFFIKCDQRYPPPAGPGGFRIEPKPQNALPDGLHPAPQWVEADGSKFQNGEHNSLREIAASGYFFARRLHLALGVPVGLIDSSLGGSAIGPWCAPEGLATEPTDRSYYLDRLDPEKSKIPAGLVNGGVGLYETFIYPIKGYALRGMIWHQGESTANGALYEDHARALVNGWRMVWNDPDIHAGIGQLYPFTAGPGYRWVETSWAQYRAGQHIPLAGSIVLNDHGDLDDIHPRNKLASGERYAAWALSEVYERGGLPQGPHPRKARWNAENQRIEIDFDLIGEGLRLNTGEAPEEFRVRCADDAVYDCQAAISPDKKQIWLTSDQITEANPALLVEHGWVSRGNATPNVVNSDNHPLTVCKIAIRQDFTAATLTEQDAQADRAWQASLRENVTAPYFLDSSYSFRLVDAPSWLKLTESGILYGLPTEADLGLNTCKVELDDGDGRVASATLQVHVVPAGSLQMVGWERGWYGYPDHQVAGVEAFFFGAHPLTADNSQTYVDSSADGTWGSQSIYPQPETTWWVSRIQKQGQFSIANHTGADVTLAGIHFDCIQAYGDIPKMTLQYTEGDLADPVGTELYSAPVTGDSWVNHDVPFAGKLNDVILADGETATFTLDFEPVWTPCFIDNAAITFRASGTKGNVPPVFASQVVKAADAEEDSMYAGSLSGSAVDVNTGDALRYKKLDGPSWLSIAPDGTLSGTPENRHVGTNQFKVEASDGSGSATRGLLEISVRNTNDAPSFAEASFNAPDAYEGAPYARSIADAAQDPDAGDRLSYSLVAGPAWLKVAANGALTGTPAASDQGANTFKVQVDDGAGGTETATLLIQVNGANALPTFNVETVKVPDALADFVYGATLAGSVTDADGDAPTFAKVSGPAWLNIAADGALSGTPTAADMGTQTFEVSVDDGKAGGDTATLQIEVGEKDLLLLAGWQSFPSGAHHGSTFPAEQISEGVSATLSTHNGSGGGGVSVWDAGKGVGSTSGLWGGFASMTPSPSADLNGAFFLRANYASGTEMPYMDITITAVTSPIHLAGMVFDRWTGATEENDSLLYYLSGDLDDPDNTLLVHRPAGCKKARQGSIEAEPTVVRMAFSALKDRQLDVGQTGTFRLYAGGYGAGGFLFHDNIAVIGETGDGQDGVKSSGDTASDWQMLFNGKDLEGWKVLGAKQDFSVQDGLIVSTTKADLGNGFLTWHEKVKDFELRFEVKCRDEVNSGCQIRSLALEEHDGHLAGPQVEITRGGYGSIYGEWLNEEQPDGTVKGRGFISGARKNAKDCWKSDQWNQFRVLAEGPRYRVWVNGVLISDFEDPKTDLAGFIGLQVHGAWSPDKVGHEVRWRNIRLRKLDREEKIQNNSINIDR